MVATVGCFGLPSQALALQQEGGAEVEKVEQGGNYDLYGVQAGFNVPLVQDKIGLRIAGAYRNRGGYITNVVGDESQTRDRISIRGQLLFDLEDAGELRLLAGYNRGKDDCCMAIWTQRSPFIEANSAPFSAFAPTAGAPNVGADAVDPYLANDNTNFVNPFHGWSIAAHYDVSLPFGELSYLGCGFRGDRARCSDLIARGVPR